MNLNNFKNKLSGNDWTLVYQAEGAENKFDVFNKIITKLHNDCFPVVTTKIKTKNLFKPWLTGSILNSIKKKNNMYKNYIKSRSPSLKNKYLKYKNKLVTIIRQAEKKYYADKLSEVKDNLAKTWKVINEMCGKKCLHKQVNKIKVNDKIIDDPQLIANQFNDYFANVGSSLAKNIPRSTKLPSDFLKGSFPNSMFLQPTNELEVSEVISNLKNTKSKGSDNIPITLIKNCSVELSSILAYLNNQSFLDGIFPSVLKIAKVIPVHKNDDVCCISNYRPISVLTAFSKVSEKLVCVRLNKYISENAILHSSQYGFREKLSTSMALLKLTEDVSRSIDDGNLTVGVFIDLAKAFDTVDHKILLNKLNHYGIRGVVNNWFNSYLSNREQFVKIGESNSSLCRIKCGVPQGSILGPILFLIYINDLNQISTIIKTIMFADDTNLFLSGKNISDIEKQFNKELIILTEWFNSNLLSLNIKKTSYIVFSNKRNINVNLLLSGVQISRVDDTRFLGVVISSNLSWNKHIDVIVSKISKTVGLLSKVRHLLPNLGTRTLYMSLVEPYIGYCNIVWSQANASVYLDKIFKIQKKYCRIITFSDFRAHSEPLFKELNILNVYNMYKYQIALFMYKQLNGLIPLMDCFSFTTNFSVHDHYTRQGSNLHMARCRTTKRQLTIFFQGPKIWNSLPLSLRDSPSILFLKKHLKKYLLL